MYVPERFQFLLPFECDLVRVGSSGDGGYVVPLSSLENTSSLISLGIASEWSFDCDFLQRRKGISYLACDRTSGFLVHCFWALRTIVNQRPVRVGKTFRLLRTAMRFLRLVPPWPFSRQRVFVRRWLKPQVRDLRRDVTIAELLERHSTSFGIFIKMDIEGGEYEVLPQIMRLERDKPGTFVGLCIEFHDIEDREKDFVRVVTELQDVFAVVHLHANNIVPVVGDFPSVLELSFAPRDTVGAGRVRTFPRKELDYPNNSLLPDISLSFLPIDNKEF